MTPRGNRTNHPTRKGWKLTPSKGGRSDRLNIRITPRAKAALSEMAERQGKSTADLIETWIIEHQQQTDLEIGR